MLNLIAEKCYCRRNVHRSILILMLILIVLILTQEVVMAQDFDASLNVMAYDREVTVKINGIQLKKITGGQSQSVRLFLADAPEIKEVAPQYKELFCMKEGENTIEISFKEKLKSKDNLPSKLTISIDSGNYKVPVLQYEVAADVKQGEVKGKFLIYKAEPKGFKTQVLK